MGPKPSFHRRLTYLQNPVMNGGRPDPRPKAGKGKEAPGRGIPSWEKPSGAVAGGARDRAWPLRLRVMRWAAFTVWREAVRGGELLWARHRGPGSPPGGKGSADEGRDGAQQG